MKAAVYRGQESLPVEEVPDPILENGEVLLEIEACAVCGTDKRTFHNGDPRIAEGRILGHEFCGRVVESRADGEGVRRGDRVVMYIVLPCGRCRYCRRGRSNLCLDRTTMAYHHDGAFAPYMRVPAAAVSGGHLFKVDEDTPAVELAIAEPLGCILNAHSRLGIGVHDTVAVVGAGPIGVMHAVVSRLEGAQKVFLLEASAPRLKIAEQFDLDGLIPVSEDGSHLEALRQATDGFGADVVIVACSSPHAQADALEMAARAGRVEFFGGLPKSSPFARLNTNNLHYKEITVTGSFSEKMSDFQAAQALLQSGRFPADRIVTHRLPLERITESFSLMERGEALKVAIEPG